MKRIFSSDSDESVCEVMLSDKQLARVKDVRNLPKVEVDWVDSATRGWHRFPSEAREETGLVQCRSVGYLILKTRKRLTLMQSAGEYGRMGDALSIPASCVKRVKVLR